MLYLSIAFELWSNSSKKEVAAPALRVRDRACRLVHELVHRVVELAERVLNTAKGEQKLEPEAASKREHTWNPKLALRPNCARIAPRQQQGILKQAQQG